MADVVTPAIRSKMMAGIKSRHTGPEMMLRKLLHGMGFRYRLHDRHLPGTPDMIFPKYNAVIFVHGCFWHGHQCKLFKWPSSNADFWKNKITSNVMRDESIKIRLTESGWRVGVIWECAIRESAHGNMAFASEVAAWLQTGTDFLEIGS